MALTNAKKESDAQKETSFAKERAAQARILDLEAQLSRSTQNTESLKRSKDEAERKFSSRLQVRNGTTGTTYIIQEYFSGN